MENTSVSAILKRIPYDIVVFFIFCLAITTFSFYLRLDINKELRTSLMPYTGWGFGRGYMSAMIFILIGLMSSRSSASKTLQILRIIVIVLMSVNLYDGVQDWLLITPEDYTNPNPYLRYDILTPIYTIFTPLFWILLMAGTLGWLFFKSKKENNLNPEVQS
ncbi:hypothetical protein [Flavobacterium sp. 102]|uniref:hypothetical protein n=1 Tax=Flavobacterium sp. 102 TaxID=2135623 RepID=UPI000EAC1C03|nr:hypothetical protein [Flavobacterium sp. 102]RKS01319.1 hypothetical protein C8C84_0969 [Flavobacterium sp. 102]